MQLTIPVKTLKNIFESCKPFTGNSRFECIQVVCAEGNINFNALDGTKLISISMYDAEAENGMMCIPIIKLPKLNVVTITETERDIVFDFVDSKQTVRKNEWAFSKSILKLFPCQTPVFYTTYKVKNLYDALAGFKNDDYVKLEFFARNEGAVLTAKNKRVLVLPTKT